MSNINVGPIYGNVIETTVNTSSQDFIDAGLSLDILDSLRLLWQQKLGATGVATFHWQRPVTPPPPIYPGSNVRVKKEPEESKFHNPALAAIRASQQLQELANMGDVNGSDEGVKSSIQALQDLAAEEERKFQDQGHDRNRSESSTPENWSHPAGNMDGHNNMKRRISEVSDVEIQQSRPIPSMDHMPYQIITDTHPPVLHPSLNHLYPSPTPKRRPDPNDDTIGSDLDDSEEEGDIDSEDEDEDMPLMLCSYDKVHRTKNKWRANLSNGVVCINGREWVFEKGNGEYEW